MTCSEALNLLANSPALSVHRSRSTELLTEPQKRDGKTVSVADTITPIILHDHFTIFILKRIQNSKSLYAYTCSIARITVDNNDYQIQKNFDGKRLYYATNREELRWQRCASAAPRRLSAFGMRGGEGGARKSLHVIFKISRTQSWTQCLSITIILFSVFFFNINYCYSAFKRRIGKLFIVSVWGTVIFEIL